MPEGSPITREEAAHFPFLSAPVVISLENKDETIVKSKKTKVKKQTLLPVWEEDFEFIARDTTQNLRFT